MRITRFLLLVNAESNFGAFVLYEFLLDSVSGFGFISGIVVPVSMNPSDIK